MKKLNFLLVTVLAVFLFGCSKDSDANVTPPAKEYFTQCNPCEAMTVLKDYVADVTNANYPH